MFSISSRYYGLPTRKWKSADGREIAYVTRRLLPSVDHFSVLFEHTVAEGERLDSIAAKHLEDPEQFWRIADANGAMRPFDLADKPGRKVRITLPEGVPGARNA